MTEIACRRDGAEAFSLWGSEDAVDDLTLDQVAQERYVLGSLEKINQSAHAPNRPTVDSPTAIHEIERRFRVPEDIPGSGPPAL
jgi:hypothetical protein